MKKLLVLFSALTFSAAAASAQTVTPAQPKHHTEHGNRAHKTPEQHADQAAQHMAKQLNLTAAQTEQVRQLQLSRYQEMQQFRAQHATADNAKPSKGMHKGMKAHQAQYDARLKQILQPDQYAKYAQQRTERMAKHKEHKGNRKADS